MEDENGLYADVQGDDRRSHSETTRLLQQQQQQQHQQQQQQPDPSQGYPVYISNMTGMPYHAPRTGGGYGAGYDGPIASPPQQQVPVVFVAQSFMGAIMYSCLVFWFCNIPFGLTGFIMVCE